MGDLERAADLVARKLDELEERLRTTWGDDGAWALYAKLLDVAVKLHEARHGGSITPMA